MGFNVSGKTALVTGSNRGIGKVIVETLLEHGASKVYAAARNLDSLSEMVKASGGKIVPVQIDLEKPETITAAAASHQDVQLVINNAGVLSAANLLEPEAETALKFEMEVNVLGLMRMARAFAPVLASQGGGAFVQLNSVASVKNFANLATYCASKAAAYSITQALRDLLAAQGTQVLSVHPGPIATDMANSAGFAEIAEPPSLIAEGIITALAAGEFHTFPDTMARNVWTAYESFARNVIEAPMSEG